MRPSLSGALYRHPVVVLFLVAHAPCHHHIQQQNGEDILVNHLNAIDKSRDTGESVIELYDGCDFSFFDDMIREETATVHLKHWNRYTDTRF